MAGVLIGSRGFLPIATSFSGSIARMPPGKRRRKKVNRKAIAAFLADLDHDLQIVENTRSQLVRDVCRHNEDLMIPAIHEADHCVAAWAAGFPIVEMDLREEYSPFSEDHPPTAIWQVHEQRLARHYLGDRARDGRDIDGGLHGREAAGPLAR